MLLVVLLLFGGLIEKGNWTVRQLGAALKHESYDIVQLSDDFVIKPIDGFGNKEMLRIDLLHGEHGIQSFAFKKTKEKEWK